MNALHIVGNLTANPESRVVNGQNGPQTVCNFTVAVNRYARGKKVTEYFRITLWNKQAENAMKYLAKGRQVGISGPVTARAYMGRDGQARASLEIQEVQEIEYLGGRTDSPAMESQGGAGEALDDGFAPVDDDELPWGN